MTTSPLKAEELKSCPFCGRGDGVLFIRPSDNWRYMQCLSCLGASGARADVESAIRAWNQRAAIVIEQSDFDTFSPHDCGDDAVWMTEVERTLRAAGITVKGD
ncbi:Lar family restriction alleviation protein [Buttiauxella sp. BIGb0552]|nr:Lar family restriction alleviation protein [Buttiauxella sp. BIGb0552]